VAPLPKGKGKGDKLYKYVPEEQEGIEEVEEALAAASSGYTRAATASSGYPTSPAKEKAPETPPHKCIAKTPEVQGKKEDGTGEPAPTQNLLDAVLIMRAKFNTIWGDIIQDEAERLA
jgi:hypothetical protein